MKIGLIDVDSHNFPNFALMRTSAFHKEKGNSVEWATPFEHYDRIYASKVFTFTPDINRLEYRCDEFEWGGGQDMTSESGSRMRLRNHCLWTIQSIPTATIRSSSSLAAA